MLKIYHAPNTRGIRIIWLCEELGMDYEVVKIDFSAEYRATEEWRRLNPVGKVPVMDDDGMTMFESGAMLQYVLERYGNNRLAPAVDSPEYGQYLQWFWFAEATFSRPLGEIVNHWREFPGDKQVPEVVEEMKNRSAVSAQAVADYMQGRDYLVLDTFTAADIMMGYTVMLVEMLIPERMPEHLLPYWERLKARPAYQTAMQT